MSEDRSELLQRGEVEASGYERGWDAATLTVADFCWLFTALRHGGDLEQPETWAMHEPTAEKAVRLLAERRAQSASEHKQDLRWQR